MFILKSFLINLCFAAFLYELKVLEHDLQSVSDTTVFKVYSFVD